MESLFSQLPSEIEIVENSASENKNESDGESSKVTANPWFAKISEYIAIQTKLPPLEVVATATRYVEIITMFQSRESLPEDEVEQMIRDLLRADSLSG